VYAAHSKKPRGLEAYINLFKIDMSSRYAGSLDVIWYFETTSCNSIENYKQGNDSHNGCQTSENMIFNFITFN
jgi:hypothetical protein